MKNLYRKLFWHYYWLSAYKAVGDKVYTPIKCPKDFWAADPFLFEHDGDTYVFFEYTDVKKNKSVIAYTNITKAPDKIEVAYEFAGHTSYPCIFEHGGRIYMIPETCYGREIYLMECVGFPGKWTQKSVLLCDIDAVDTTVFYSGGELKCFVYTFDYHDDCDRKLYIGNVDIDGGKITDLQLVKDYGSKDGRPGGNCYYDGDRMLRVVQPDHCFYGEKLEFYSFDYTAKQYSEKLEYIINPSDVAVDTDKKIVGVHTYNKTGNYEIVDLRVDYFDLFKAFKRLFAKLGICGYDDYEGKQKYLHGDFAGK